MQVSEAKKGTIVVVEAPNENSHFSGEWEVKEQNTKAVNILLHNHKGHPVTGIQVNGAVSVPAKFVSLVHG